MAKSSRGKRPCSICRKWFQPDVRQKGRQVTCGNPACQRELHRRDCQKWNKKNKEYFQNDYLNKKIEMAEAQQPESSQANVVYPQQSLPKSRTKLVLPYEILAKEYGMKNLIILQYLIYQVMHQLHDRTVDST